jgi:hypothetical protein
MADDHSTGKERPVKIPNQRRITVGIPYPFGHPFHAHSATDSTLIRPPIPQAFGH